MNDTSDGLASELLEIAKASSVGIKINADAIPLSQELLLAAPSLNKQPLDYALYGVEDYQLVFTISKSNFNLLK